MKKYTREELSLERAHLICLSINAARRIHRTINYRVALLAAIQRCRTEDGKLYVEESGMDCDGVQYWGLVHCVDASVKAFHQLKDYRSEWADGPVYLRIITKEEADHLEYGSRDRALEAFENGHPHCWYT